MPSSRSFHASGRRHPEPRRSSPGVVSCFRGAVVAACVSAPVMACAEVLISEIHYHPATEDIREEFIELTNTSALPCDVGGWKFTKGIRFTIPAGTVIPGHGQLAIAADPAVFAAIHPLVVNVVGGWQGRLSNSSDRITLADATGTEIDIVDYADEGDWGVRRIDWWSDHGHKGLAWDSSADGGVPPPPHVNAPADPFAKGRTLELITPALDNNCGQNWGASASTGGTPGAPNSLASGDVAPLIRDVSHFPPVPRSSDAVFVLARLENDDSRSVEAWARWRTDGSGAFTAVAMADDGQHGDLLAGDGLYGAILPVQPDGTIVEFHVEATDGIHPRSWPAPVLGDNGTLTPAQIANCLYQVEDTPSAGAMPLYRVVMKATDKTQLAGINANGAGGTHPHPYYTGETNDQTLSHARFNASVVLADGTGTSIRYRVGVRNRGNGSRSRSPQGFNIAFPGDAAWDGSSQFNLNTQYTPYQLLGAALFAESGIPAPRSRAVGMRWNGIDPLAGGGPPAYGFYACNDAWDSDLIDLRFPNDSSGNLYRATRNFQGVTAGGTSIPNGGELNKITPGPGETLSLIDLHKLNYNKRTNTSEDDWTDLFALEEALAKGQSGSQYTSPVSWDVDYAASVRAVADVEEWMRWFAVNTLIDNSETNLSNGDGDDFHFYFGRTDPRCRLMPYDLDTILGGGDSPGSPTAGLFRMIARNSSSSPTAPTPMNAFMKHPEFAPIYYRSLVELMDGPFEPSRFATLAEQTLGAVASDDIIESAKAFASARVDHIRSRIPRALAVTTHPAISQGYPATTAATIPLAGVADAITTRSVSINGVAAQWSAFGATWSAASVPLHPGINRLMIRSHDEAGSILGELAFDVWRDDGGVAVVSGTLTANTQWTAAAGPYSVPATVVVPAGVTLQVEAGTSIYLGAGAGIHVASGGRLLVNGTADSPVRFTRAPGSAGNWGGLVVQGSPASPSPVTEIRHSRFEFNGSTAVHAQAGGEIVLESVAFANSAVPYLSLDGASFLVRSCHFPATTASFEPLHGSGGIKAGGRGILRDCYIGFATSSIGSGYNDAFDFTGGKRPAPILQVLGNVFAGSDDDALDLDGTDAWIEGNLFLHCHRNGNTPDSSAAISGGSSSGMPSHLTITRNIFFDVDHAVTAKEGNHYLVMNNTIVRQTRTGGLDTQGGVLNLADEGTSPGGGCHFVGNILHECDSLVRGSIPPASAVVFTNNLMGLAWFGSGGGNLDGDPLFTYLPRNGETNFSTLGEAAILRHWLRPRPSSPATRAGPHGLDLGANVPPGAALLASVGPLASAGTASFSVGPNSPAGLPWTGGQTAYRFRLDAGAWSGIFPIQETIVLSGLPPGQHVLEVSARNDADTWQDDPAVHPEAAPTRFEWTVDPEYQDPGPMARVRINEVLARNSESLSVGGVYPDLIEIHNAGDASADLSGWGLTDDAFSPYRYTFPPGTILQPGGYLVLHASSAATVPQPRTGFALAEEGETLNLRSSPLAGGVVVDSITFGNQLADHSLGRAPGDGSWGLCLPSFGSRNRPITTGSAGTVRINEWLASAASFSADDFVELFNTGDLAVDLAGCHLTDNPSGWPDRHAIAAHSFIGPRGYLVFKADGNTGSGPEHLSFRLDATQGEIALMTAALESIDTIIYGPQSTDVSQGRGPDGSGVISFFTQPTPGGPNPGTTAGRDTIKLNLLGTGAIWRYKASLVSYHENVVIPPALPYQAVEFDDSSWASGAQLLHYETGSLASVSGFVKTTQVPRNGSLPFPCYYFRTHFDYTGPLEGVALRAITMVDDAAILYLNGVEIQRIRMPAGAISYASTGGGAIGPGTEAAEETWSLPSGALRQGDNVLAVEVHQANSTSSDVVWGMKLDAEITTNVAAVNVVINEMLVEPPGSGGSPWVELHNPGTVATDIGGLGLARSPTTPREWVASPGTILPAGGYLVITCDAAAPPSESNTGFAPDHDALYLHLPVALGGGLLDSVAWGNQLAGFSIGRIPDGAGAFALNIPTPSAINGAAAIASVSGVRLNEWLANPANGSDWIELFNPAGLPVPLGGNYLTDSLGNKTKHKIPPLSFIGGSGDSRWLAYWADNSTSSGHVNFALGAGGEALGLFTSSGAQIDALSFGPQSVGVSEGRYPDGSASMVPMSPSRATANTLGESDSDGDGMPDAWESAHGLNPTSPTDAGSDADQDGFTNLAEFIAGTDPRDSSSRLLASVSRSPGSVLVSFLARPGKSYTVQVSGNLRPESWVKLADVSPLASSTMVSVADPDALARPIRFYRVLTPSQP